MHVTREGPYLNTSDALSEVDAVAANACVPVTALMSSLSLAFGASISCTGAVDPCMGDSTAEFF